MNVKCCFSVVGIVLTLLGCSTPGSRSDPPLNTVQVLVPGDRFFIVYEPQPSKNQKRIFTVDEKGNVALPLLGRVNVAGMEPHAAAEMLKRLYVERGFYNEALPIAIEPLER